MNRSTLFKTIANKLVGYWYNFTDDEVLIFFLPDTLTEEGSVQVTGEGTTYTTTFRLTSLPNKELEININKLFHPFTATLKVLSNDTLIFQDPNQNIHIYERRIHTEFVTSVIEAAHS